MQGTWGRCHYKQKSCMMSDTAWISIAPGSGTNLRPLRHSFSETDQRQDAIAWGNQNVAGEPLKAECFPSEIYGAPQAKESDYRLPHIFFAGSFWAVSKAAADVLRQFDLGGGGLFRSRCSKKTGRRRWVASGSASISATGKRQSPFLNPHPCEIATSGLKKRDGFPRQLLRTVTSPFPKRPAQDPTFGLIPKLAMHSS